MLQAHLDKPYGYIEEFCIKCTSSDQTHQREDITYDNYRVQLPSKCGYAMQEKSDVNVEPIIFVHDDADAGDKVFENGFTQFFENVGLKHGIDNNDGEELCPIISCKLMKKDCRDDWTGGDGGNIKM